MTTFRPTGIDKPLRLAFLGCGSITRRHSKTLEKLKLPVRRYFASRGLEKASRTCAELRGDGFFDRYASAINSPEIDAVFIATPPHLHLELTLQALSAGKHVIVEKPPFLHVEDIDAVQNAQGDCQVLVAENYFYKPLRKTIAQIIHEKQVGDPLFVTVNALKKQRVDDWRLDPDISGGGALFEGGIHWINFLSNIGLTPLSVNGFQPKSLGKMEKSMQVVFNYQEGAVGNLFYSWEVPTLFQGLRISRIFGREGSVTFESNGLFVLVRGKRVRLVFPGFRDISGFNGMFTDFVQAIRTGTPARYTLEMARQDLQRVASAYATAER